MQIWKEAESSFVQKIDDFVKRKLVLDATLWKVLI